MSSKKPKKQPKSQSNLFSFPVDPRGGSEKIMRDLQKMIEERGLTSIDQINAFMQGLTASGGFIPESPSNLSALEKAQDIMYRAWEARGSQRVKLARRALEISPDCADAYVLLADEAAYTPKEAQELYEKAVEAGKRAIGAEFHNLVGHFWGFIETRPYMRARAGLADVLWFQGKKQQAIEHYQDMLRLNPNDNQGIRYVLLDCLMDTEQFADADKLLKQYKDDWSASWHYTTALLTFRREGASRKANRQLQKAIEHNGFVPAFLLSKKKLPRQSPGFISPGQENEAIEYAFKGVSIWGKNPAALEWLRKYVEENPPR